jgi:hypothetical protein
LVLKTVIFVIWNPAQSGFNPKGRRYNHHCFLYKTLEEAMNYFLFSRPFRNGTRLLLLLAILLLNFGYGGTRVAYAAPPIHDDFNAAKTIVGIEYHDLNVNTIEATPSDTVPNVDDPNNFLCDGTNHLAGFASVWYKYTPPEVQAIGLNTIGTDYDTYIAVWTGTRGALNLVACNDETSSGFSELSFIASAGIQYYIEIAQFNDGLGTTDNIGGSLDFNAYITNTEVKIGGVLRGRYYIPDSGGLRRSFINLNNGPVEVRNLAGNQMIAAERVIYSVNNVPTSFSELMGLPNSQLGTTYWLPWYNNVDLDTQLRFANVSGSPATVHVSIKNVPMPGSPFTLLPGESTRKSFPGVNSGPVKIESNVNIVAAERVIYKINGIPVSFTEMMGLPSSQLNTTYWLPWYNNVDLDTQLRIGNVSASPATVTITIGGIPMGNPIPLAVGASTRVSFAGVNRGPVKIVSTQNIVAAERVIQRVNNIPVSFSEMMGLPNNQLNTIYWLPWYNNVSLDTQLRLGNVSATTATVRVFIGGLEMTGSPFTLAAGASIRKSYVGVDSGPVRIESNVNIVAAERVIYKINGLSTSFSEMMGLPNSSLDVRYWMPWYNNVDLDTQLRFALP